MVSSIGNTHHQHHPTTLVRNSHHNNGVEIFAGCKATVRRKIAKFNAEKWSVKEVYQWLSGIIGDSNCIYFKQSVMDGKQLVDVDTDSIEKMGVKSEYSRKAIMKAISHLKFYSFDLFHTNLQKLAMDTVLSIDNFLQIVSKASNVFIEPLYSNYFSQMLGRIFRALSEVYDRVVTLNFWLDRRPFVDKSRFSEFRCCLSQHCGDMINSINNPKNSKYFFPDVFIEAANSLHDICQKIIHDNDPCVIYTMKLERVRIRRTLQDGNNWGFDVGISPTGINTVTDVLPNEYDAVVTRRIVAPKLEPGDEILQVNDTCVVGWKFNELVKKLNDEIYIRHSTTHAHDNSFSPPKPSTLPRITGAASSGSNNFECVLLVCRHSLRDYDQQQNTPVAAIRPPKILLPLPSESPSDYDWKPENQAIRKSSTSFVSGLGPDENLRNFKQTTAKMLLTTTDSMKRIGRRTDATLLKRARSSSIGTDNTALSSISSSSSASFLSRNAGVGHSFSRMRRSCFLGNNEVPTNANKELESNNMHSDTLIPSAFPSLMPDGSFLETLIALLEGPFANGDLLFSENEALSPTEARLSESSTWFRLLSALNFKSRSSIGSFGILSPWKVDTAEESLGIRSASQIHSPVSPNDYETSGTEYLTGNKGQISVVIPSDETVYGEYFPLGPNTHIGGSNRCRRKGQTLLIDPNAITYSTVEAILSEPETNKPLNTPPICSGWRRSTSEGVENDVGQYHSLLSTSAADPDWWTAPQSTDITGLRLEKRMHLESGGSAASILDSPLSTIHAKIARFFGSSGTGNTEIGTPTSTTIPHSVTTPILRSPFVTDSSTNAFLNQQQLRTPTAITSTPLTPTARLSHEFLSLFFPSAIVSQTSKEKDVLPPSTQSVSFDASLASVGAVSAAVVSNNPKAILSIGQPGKTANKSPLPASISSTFDFSPLKPRISTKSSSSKTVDLFQSPAIEIELPPQTPSSLASSHTINDFRSVCLRADIKSISTHRIRQQNDRLAPLAEPDADDLEENVALKYDEITAQNAGQFEAVNSGEPSKSKTARSDFLHRCKAKKSRSSKEKSVPRTTSSAGQLFSQFLSRFSTRRKTRGGSEKSTIK